METFLDYGQELMLDKDYISRNPDYKTFHLHPHYEMMITLVPVVINSTLCGEPLYSDFPSAVITSPFIPHFSNLDRKEPCDYLRYVFYFGTTVISSLHLPFSINELLGNGISRIINLTPYVGQMQRLISSFEVLHNDTERRLVFGSMLCVVQEAAKLDAQRNIVMNHMEDYILRVIEYISNHLSEKCSTQQLADMFFVSPDKLRKDFKRCTYVNIGEFVQRMRLNLARELLTDRKMSISDVVRECGYESESHFYKLFRSATGKTPLEYKKKYKMG